MKFEFDGHTPVADGAIDGIEGKLTFDTGSRSHVTLRDLIAAPKRITGG